MLPLLTFFFFPSCPSLLPNLSLSFLFPISLSRSFLPLCPGDVVKHVSASAASQQEAKSVRQEVICLDIDSSGSSEDDSKANIPISAATEHKTGETHTHIKYYLKFLCIYS